MKYFNLGSFTLSTNKSIPTQEEIDKKNAKENKKVTAFLLHIKATQLQPTKDVKKGD